MASSAVWRSATVAAVAVGPTAGAFAGQRARRGLVVQLRGAARDPAGVVVRADGAVVAGAGTWRRAEGSADGHDAFTEPRGALVVEVGEVDIRAMVTVVLLFDEAPELKK